MARAAPQTGAGVSRLALPFQEGPDEGARWSGGRCAARVAARPGCGCGRGVPSERWTRFASHFIRRAATNGPGCGTTPNFSLLVTVRVVVVQRHQAPLKTLASLFSPSNLTCTSVLRLAHPPSSATSQCLVLLLEQRW